MTRRDVIRDGQPVERWFTIIDGMAHHGHMMKYVRTAVSGSVVIGTCECYGYRADREVGVPVGDLVECWPVTDDEPVVDGGDVLDEVWDQLLASRGLIRAIGEGVERVADLIDGLRVELATRSAKEVD